MINQEKARALFEEFIEKPSFDTVRAVKYFMDEYIYFHNVDDSAYSIKTTVAKPTLMTGTITNRYLVSPEQYKNKIAGTILENIETEPFFESWNTLVNIAGVVHEHELVNYLCLRYRYTAESALQLINVHSRALVIDHDNTTGKWRMR